jgi:hypothetical protein
LLGNSATQRTSGGYADAIKLEFSQTIQNKKMRYVPTAIVICFATALPAQITSKVITATTNVTWVKSGSTSKAEQSIPPQVDVTGGANISATNGMRCNLWQITGKTSLAILGGGGNDCSLSSAVDVSGSSWNCSSGSGVVTSCIGDVRFLLTSGSGVVNGTLAVTVDITTGGGFGDYTVEVDVGDDGSKEFFIDAFMPAKSGNQVYSISLPLSVGPKPATVRLSSHLGGNSAFGSGHTVRVSAAFVPTGGTVTKRGDACQSGVDLEVSHFVHKDWSGRTIETVKIRPKSLPSSAIACVYAFGDQEWQIPLAPTNCLLRNNATVLMFVLPSAPELSLWFPAWTTPITFYGQFAFATKATGGYDLLHTSDSFLAVLK